jgi:hypothetical protein
LSSFDAHTDGRTLAFTFRLDTTSVVDLIHRRWPAALAA